MDTRFDGKRALVTGAGKGMLIIKMISVSHDIRKRKCSLISTIRKY